VRYWYNDHKTKQRQEEEVSALTFTERPVLGCYRFACGMCLFRVLPLA
jgi:hypothetical protein